MRMIALTLLMMLAASPVRAAEQDQAIYLHEYSGGLHVLPEELTLNVGDTLVWTVYNQGASAHNLRLCGDPSGPLETCSDIWGFTPMIEPNQSAPMRAELKKAGTFDYYCYIPGHKSGGMGGVLHVQGGADERNLPALPLAVALLALAALARWRGR